jgi:hypothetical protein
MSPHPLHHGHQPGPAMAASPRSISCGFRTLSALRRLKKRGRIHGLAVEPNLKVKVWAC